MSLDNFLKSVKKDFAKTNPNIVFDKNAKIEYIKTGCLPFDMIVGGFPKQKISEVFGPEHSGKSSLMYSTAAEIKKNGGCSLYIDVEHAFNKEFAKKAFDLEIGPNFVLLEPNNAEEVGALLDLFLSDPNNKVDAIFLDSIAGTQSKAAIDCSLEDTAKIGDHARTIGRVVNKLRDITAKYNCAVILVNQLRAALNINPYAPKNGLGNMDTSDMATTGGNSPRYYSSIRVKLSNKIRKETAFDSLTGKEATNVIVGNLTTFKIIKNKCGIPHVHFDSNFDLDVNGQKPGWNYKKDLIGLLRLHGIIEQRAAKFVYHGSTTAFDWTNSEGKERAELLFSNMPELLADAEKQMISRFKNDKESILGSIQLDDYEKDTEDQLHSDDVIA